MTHAERQIRDAGAPLAYLDASPNAEAFYARRGYGRAGEVKANNSIPMSKRLVGDTRTAMANQHVTGFVESNGARLYYEKQGTGRSVLFIAGSTGDAGNFTRAAALLADEFTVVAYDRRGNSRSEPPPGWKTTSVAEQADDAAGLIQALGLEPAVVFGASAGGPIALDLMLRHPRLVRAGILQDPAIFSLLPDPAAALAPRRALIQTALETKGPRGTIAALMCYLNDDAVLTAIPPDILGRMLDNAETILNVEGPGFAGWQPSRGDLASLGVPVVLMSAADTLPVYRQVIDCLARELNVEPLTVPGRHAFYYYRPGDLADVLRPILRRFVDD